MSAWFIREGKSSGRGGPGSSTCCALLCWDRENWELFGLVLFKTDTVKTDFTLPPVVTGSVEELEELLSDFANKVQNQKDILTQVRYKVFLWKT